MHRLHNPIKQYAWGSRTALAELAGRPVPAANPEAELWLGAHPSAPSEVDTPGGRRGLDALIADDPQTHLGERVLGRHGPRLPFLLKVLAAAEPLSLQAHPTRAQAAAGFADEEARGVPLDAPHRNYRDPNHKPELLAALGPFRALCGFRDPAASARLLAALGVSALTPTVRALGAPAGLRAAFAGLLSLDASARTELVTATVAACEREVAEGGEFAADCAMAMDLAARYPGDVGVVTALLLNRVELARGQALYLPAGNLHAYLEGVGVEIMASSDNVLRGGLTPKHVDVPELLRIVDFSPVPAAARTPAGASGESVYATDAEEFRLSVLELDGRGPAARTTGPEILLVTAGAVALEAGGDRLDLVRGESVYLPASTGPYRLAGCATVYRATVPG